MVADDIQGDARHGTQRRLVVENISENAPDDLKRVFVAVYRQGRALANVVGTNVVEAENMVGMAVGEQDGVEALEPGAHSLLAKVGGGVDDHIVTVPRQQKGGAEPLVVQIGRAANTTGAAKRRHAHGSAGAEHGYFQRSACHLERAGETAARGGAAWLISTYVILSLPSRSRSRLSSSGARFPLVFSCKASSMSISSRAASGSITGCPVRGSLYAPRTIAAFWPSMRTRFSNAATGLGASAGGALAGAFACSGARATLASRSCSSTTSLRSSPSEVKGRRSMTRNVSSCLWSDKCFPQ